MGYMYMKDQDILNLSNCVFHFEVLSTTYAEVKLVFSLFNVISINIEIKYRF